MLPIQCAPILLAVAPKSFVGIRQMILSVEPHRAVESQISEPSGSPGSDKRMWNLLHVPVEPVPMLVSPSSMYPSAPPSAALSSV